MIEHTLREIVNARCKCGGSGPDDIEACVWCKAWHAHEAALRESRARAFEEAAVVAETFLAGWAHGRTQIAIADRIRAMAKEGEKA